MEFGDYSHCHYWNFERTCIGFDCDDCKYKNERQQLDSQTIDVTDWVEWEKLFEI